MHVINTKENMRDTIGNIFAILWHLFQDQLWRYNKILRSETLHDETNNDG